MENIRHHYAFNYPGSTVKVLQQVTATWNGTAIVLSGFGMKGDCELLRWEAIECNEGWQVVVYSNNQRSSMTQNNLDLMGAVRLALQHH